MFVVVAPLSFNRFPPHISARNAIHNLRVVFHMLSLIICVILLVLFCWRARWIYTLLSNFIQWVFNSPSIRIMISLVVFLKPFMVCITIETITNFPIWNDSPLLFRIIFYSFFIIPIIALVPHLILYTS